MIRSLPALLRPALLALPMLAGCAGETDRYPSLAPRATEKIGFEEPVRAVAAVTPDPSLDAAIARQRTDLDAIVVGFDASVANAGPRIEKARGKPVGTDAWLDAQAALANLDDWRTRAGVTTAAIEALAAARAARLEPAYPPLDALAAHAATEAEREAQTIERLTRQVAAA